MRVTCLPIDIGRGRSFFFLQFFGHLNSSLEFRDCEREGIVGGDEGPVGGVAQVVCWSTWRGRTGKDGEVRREVKGKVEQLRDNRTCAWREDGMTDSRDDLSQCGCDK